MKDDLQKLLDILPQEIRQAIEQHKERDNLIEVVVTSSPVNPYGYNGSFPVSQLEIPASQAG